MLILIEWYRQPPKLKTMKPFSRAIAMATLLFVSAVSAQNFMKRPSKENIKKAEDQAKVFFSLIQKNKPREAADFIINNLGESWDESKKIQERNDYVNKFELIALPPPKGTFGKLDSYDLIEEGFLAGSDRVFRHTYIGYHEGNMLLYEFRFYVTPKGEVTLNYLGWSEKNPFEYMSTPDMLLTKWER